MELRRIVKKGLLFMVVTIFLYMIAMYGLNKIKKNNIPLIYRVSGIFSYKGGNTFRKFSDYNKNGRYDVIVIGSSHAYRGYDPRIFEKNQLNMFNLGNNGQTLLNTYYIAKNYIRESSCKLVILDIYDVALSEDGIEPAGDLIENITSSSAALEMALAMKDPRALNMITERMMRLNEPPSFLDSAYVMNGYSENKKTADRRDKSNYISYYNINENQLDYLKKVLEYVKSLHIKVVAVTHPIPLELQNGSHDKFYQRVSAITNLLNVAYLDYSRTLVLDSRKDYYDENHLNQYGVEKFNTILIKALYEMGYLSN
jgi:hypothetical protein